MIFPWIKHANTKIQIHKYTNTAYDKVPERPNMLYIFEERIVQGYQNDIPMSQIGEYKNTNLRLTNAKKTQHVVYFWREDCSWIFSESRMVVQGLVFSESFPLYYYHYHHCYHVVIAIVITKNQKPRKVQCI